MEAAFDEVYEVTRTHVEEEIDNAKYGQNLKTTAGDNATVTLTNDSIIVDFGAGTLGSDGRLRTGKVYIQYTGKYRTAGTVITTTLENYSVDGVKVEGKKVVENLGVVDGFITFSVVVTDGKVTYLDGTTVTNWNSTRTRVWITDNNTVFNPYDDIYQIYGTASGINRKGEPYVMTVPQADPLLIDIACWLSTRMPKDGIVYITPAGKEVRSVDYGAGGGCDRKVTVTVGTFTIDLSL